MSDTEEKKHQPSNRKLRKKREEGAIPSSAESVAFLATAAGILAVIATAKTTFEEFTALISLSPDLLDMPADEASQVGLDQMLRALGVMMVPVLLATICVGILAALIFNRGIVFSMKPVTPDFAKLSMTAGFKRIFGTRGWMELGSGTLRLFLWIAVVGVVAYIFVPMALSSPECAQVCQVLIARPSVLALCGAAVVLMLIFAIIEMIIQKAVFTQEQMMTETELKNERKDSSGNPEIKRERRKLRNMLGATPGRLIPESETTVLFTSTRGAVGINYAPPDQKLPIITVKARPGEQTDAVVGRMQKQGITVMESAPIVKDCAPKARGEMLDVAYFKDFAQAIAEIRRRDFITQRDNS